MKLVKSNFIVLIVLLILGAKSYGAETIKVSIKDKTLVIPMLNYSKDFESYLVKKGKISDLEKAKAKVEEYNEAWKKGISQSLYDATPYELSTDIEMSEIDKNSDKYLKLLFSYNRKTSSFFTIKTYDSNKELVKNKYNGL
ncbi:MAG: hypothetical protein H6553_12755 [Chitinophagales bacterium]|nr:hypothetical protein [Chitinophagales bacterium]